MQTTDKKLVVNYSIRVDQPTADQIEKLADYYNRKPSEFLRLILAPVLRDYWAKVQRQEHPENQEPPTLARFKD